MPTAIGRHAIVIGSVLLLGLVVVLWYAYTYQSRYSASGQDPGPRSCATAGNNS